MILLAAIYARKSTEQNVTDEEEPARVDPVVRGAPSRYPQGAPASPGPEETRRVGSSGHTHPGEHVPRRMETRRPQTGQRGPTSPAPGAGRSLGLHPCRTASRPASTEGARSEGTSRVRSQRRSLTCRHLRRPNWGLVGGGPNGIRTRVSALRGPCPGPLDDGAGRCHRAEENWLGEEDSNPRYVVQSHASYH